MCDAELNDIRKMKLLKIDHDSVLYSAGMLLYRYGYYTLPFGYGIEIVDGIRQVTIDEYNQTELVNKPMDSSALWW